MPTLGRKLWNLSINLVAGLVILLALLVGLFRLLVTQLPEYREQIEVWASGAIGRPVHIGRIDARLRLGGPELVFADAQIMAADGSRAVVVADEGSVRIDLVHLIRSGEFRARHVVLDGVQFGIQRFAPGDFRLSGQIRPAPLEDAQSLSAATLPEGTFEFRNAVVSFQDLPTDRAWTFTGVSLHLERRERLLQLDGQVKLPPSLGGLLEFSGIASGDLAAT